MVLPRKMSFQNYLKSLIGILKNENNFLFLYCEKRVKVQLSSSDKEKGTNYTFQRKTYQDTQMESMSQK